MKLPHFLCATVLLVTCIPSVLPAQTRGASALDRARALRAAKEAVEMAKDRQIRQDALDKALALSESDEGKQIQDAAKKALKADNLGATVEDLKQRAIEDARLREMLENASPEAAAIIEASQRAPELSAAAAAQLAGQALAGVGASPPDGETGVPTAPDRVVVPPRKIREPAPNDIEKGSVIITSDSAFFDATNKIAIFKGDVFVDHPGFDIWCDTLEVFFKKSAGEVSGAAPAGAAPAGDAPAGEGEGEDVGSEVEKIIATGREVRIEKQSTDGTLQIGKCRRAVYETETGNINLYIWPQVQKDKNLLIAEEESAVITFYPNGAWKALGKTKSIIAEVQKSRTEEEAAEEAPAPPPTGAP
ncbi:hypothetical protein BH23VER1_BH23VER1_18230 [soil metagenome]